MGFSPFIPLKAEVALNIALPSDNIVSNTNNYHMPIHVSNLEKSKLILHVSVYRNDYLHKSDIINVDKNGYLYYEIKTREFKARDRIKVDISYRHKKRNYFIKAEFEILDGKVVSAIKVSAPSEVDCISGQAFYLPIKISYLDNKNSEVNEHRNQDISLQLTDNKTIKKMIRLNKNASASKIELTEKKGQYKFQLKPLNTNIKVIPAKICLNIKKESKVKNISLPNEEIVIDVGEIYTINPIITPQSLPNNDIHWSSSNPDIASVDSYGHVTGKKTGEADIKVSFDGIIRKMKVNVKKRLKDIVFPEKKLYVESGKSASLDFRMNPIDADTSKINYATDDFMIAEIKDGKIIGNRPGTTHITVSADDIVGQLEIEVMPALQIYNMNKEALSLTVDDTYQIKYDVYPSTYKKQVKIRYSSDDDKIAKVSTSGKITAISSGTTEINVLNDNEQLFKIAIEVLSGKDDIRLKTDTLNISVGDSIDIKNFIEDDVDLTDLKISCECKSVKIDGTLIKAKQSDECPVILNHKGTTKILNLKIGSQQDPKESNAKISANKKDDKKEMLKKDKHSNLLYAGIIVVFTLLSLSIKNYVSDKKS